METQVALTDWGSFGDEMLGLILQAHSPFKLKVKKLMIQNFHTKQLEVARMLLNLMDNEVNNDGGINSTSLDFILPL